MKNLEKFSVQEMNNSEMEKVNGGGIFAVLLIAVVGAIIHHLWKQ
ncbi:class IIb bacteriocin, lactobin A/cerein 7B family [Flavivirga jejuensis]|uniref:Class IIb bacteriocin, lactobin A/cerein 7B family n=1 Tax=Flavivirga jejuensis TaxID=870487 RepID=A0ABT8WVK2_9FLAO|nr:class IIb bacteriocin, lactobin A/cerein 7B family [Flavivirga jejuensis]MDO5977175.1 class IIb bacteriocin, lactobin A/cerein 7B family [Flavivirga jejuensis]